MEVQMRKVKEEEIKEIEEEREKDKKDYSDIFIDIKNSYLILLDGHKVGLCTFSNFIPNSVEVRYALFTPYRNKKLFMPIWEKVREIYGKTFPTVQKLYCLVMPNNIPSLKIVQKDMEFDYEFYKTIQEEGCKNYYPYFYKNPYYKEEKKKELTYSKLDAKIKV